MAKYKILNTRRLLTRQWIVVALVLGWGVPLSWAQQRGGHSPAAGAHSTPAHSRSARSAASKTSDSPSVTGKRDPFKLPEYATGKGSAGADGFTEALPPGGVLPPGKRGLIISQLKLEGVVRQQVANKMTALVVDQRKLAYFLHDNDSVYNGVVSKITPDSVYFKENVLDSKGRVTTREVVKRLSSAPGEGR